MEIIKKLKNMQKDKRMLAAITVLGLAGLLLIMISSLVPEKKQQETSAEVSVAPTYSDSYCLETQKRLEDFLSVIEGAGEVRVYLTVSSGERYVYATEGKNSKSDSKTEVEEKYVMIGSGSDKSALIESVETPRIEGAVVACTGCSSPVVQERIYKAVSAALGLPTSKIYVTTLE